jgi:hypothetical protein
VRQILAIVGSCVLLVLVLRLAVVGADSATSVGLDKLPIATPSAAQECASFAQFWMDVSGTGPDAVASVSRCRRDTSGAWVSAEVTGKTDIELSSHNAARADDIKSQLTSFEAGLPKKLRGTLADIRSVQMNPGAASARSRERMDREAAEVSSQYTQELRTYLRDPAHRELATYAAWVVARRDSALATFQEGCEAYPRMDGTCINLVRAVGADLALWPWDLDDDLLLAEYLAQHPEPNQPPSPITD